MSACASPVFAQAPSSISHLVKNGNITQLYVSGKPFLILGGELGNSSCSDFEYMRPLWSKLKSMHLNTVLAPVYWELLEPQQGNFDFRLVDSMLAGARSQNLKLVLLWFGSWKNSMSCYAPEWVKLKQKKYERAKDGDGKGVEILSAFNNNNLQADINAFTALMKHIAEVDSGIRTVIMVQVENEIGMLPVAREHTETANLAFSQPVPGALMQYMKKNRKELVPELDSCLRKTGYPAQGNWEQVFGKGLQAEEIFQAWQYATFVNTVARAGKKIYPLPMYVNAALNHRNVKPGQYPSGGPLPHLMDIWRAGAPSIDILSPDFYNPSFKYYSDLYLHNNNPFFIPEIRSEPNNAAKVFLAIGHYNGIGFSPFSIESVPDTYGEPIGKSYQLLEQLAPIISSFQLDGKTEGILLDSAHPEQEIIMGSYKLNVAHEYILGWSPGSKNPGWPETGGIILQTGEREFIIAGTGIVVRFSSADKPDRPVGILRAQEGIYVDGNWKPGRVMNGDQDHQGRHIRIPVNEYSIQQVSLYDYY